MTDLGVVFDAVATGAVVLFAIGWLIRGAREPAGCGTCDANEPAAVSPRPQAVGLDQLSIGRRRPDTLSQV